MARPQRQRDTRKGFPPIASGRLIRQLAVCSLFAFPMIGPLCLQLTTCSLAPQERARGGASYNQGQRSIRGKVG
ncbi:hypothetical protein BaRGS_00030619, partial [Batillaria attramentaria]